MSKVTSEKVGGSLRCLFGHKAGVALVEFALGLPLLILVGGYGTELAWLAIANLRVSQSALNLADTASRVGAANGNVSQIREVDINDVLISMRLGSGGISVGKSGRVTLSSLENVQQRYDSSSAPPPQRIHWQRCYGIKKGVGYDSSYGTTKVTDGTDNTEENAGTLVPKGMGPAGAKVTAPKNSGVMYVEVNYLYTPIFGKLFLSPRIIHYTASLLVRDNRDFTQIYNPSDSYAQPSTCDRYYS